MEKEQRCRLISGTGTDNRWLKLLAGRDDSPRRDVVLFNAAVALATRDGDIQGALDQVSHALDSGAALDKLETLAAYSQALAAPQAALVH